MQFIDFIVIIPYGIIILNYLYTIRLRECIKLGTVSALQMLNCAGPHCILNITEKFMYEGCSNMIASSLITFFTYMLRQIGIRFYIGLYVTFKLATDLKKNTVYLSSYSPLNLGHFSILTNSMLRTYTSVIDERIIPRLTIEIY